MKTNASRFSAGLLLLSILCFLPAALGAQETQLVYLTGTGFDDTRTWQFKCSDGMNSGNWATIEVPSCWEQQGFGHYNYGHVPFEDRQKEEGHYRISFRAERNWKGREISLVFEGVMTDCRAELNGRTVGQVHQGAFYPFSYEVSDLLRYGKANTLDVYVKKFSDNMSVNQAERKADYWVFGGIFRPVYLEIKPQEHMVHVAVDARVNGDFRAELELSGLRGGRRVEAVISDADGQEQARFEQALPEGADEVVLSGRMMGVMPWSPEFPHLYDVSFNLLDKDGEPLHRVKEKIGFRTVAFRAQDGIYVNGARIKLKGVNRHSFHPDHGRTSSKALSIEVVNLIKDMNMNAVRMSHYPPDRHFLEVCDSLGLFVLDELAGWQRPAYDSAVGRTLLEAMIRRDVNHPSVIMWDNGNEGGWNTAYDEAFAALDIQGRQVNHPWAVHGPTNTAHYIDYGYLGGDHFAGRKVFYPTEMIHGLYDGGHGAGLEDYWLRMWNDPLCAGGFLWVFADEAVKRTDTGELDSDGNHAPDGIVGPYHEKEGSFYAIREIWSPVHFEKRFLTPDFNGQFRIQNRFHYTALDQCRFDFVWLDLPGPGDGETGSRIIGQGHPQVDALMPGQPGKLTVPLSEGWRDADVLQVNAYDPHGRLIHRWGFPVKAAAESAAALIVSDDAPKEGIHVDETELELRLSSGKVAIGFDKRSGLLKEVRIDGQVLPLSNGPVFREEMPGLSSIGHYAKDHAHLLEVHYGKEASLTWTFHRDGRLDMDLHYQPGNGRLPYTGASFDFPERDDLCVSYMGKGPYRVWKNRMKGGAFGLWNKEWNNTMTGHSGFIYPEFKGYYANLYWADFTTNEEKLFTVYSRTDDLFLRLFTPEDPPEPGRTGILHPAGDLSFMLGIPAIGSKFRPAEQFGPQSQDYYYDSRRVADGALQIDLTFDFR